MNETHMFKMVMRGYEPQMVESHIQTLTETGRTYREQAEHLRVRVSALEEALENLERQGGAPSGDDAANDSALQQEVALLQTKLQEQQAELENARQELQVRTDEAGRLAHDVQEARDAAAAAEAAASATPAASLAAPMPDDSQFGLLGARIAQILKLAEEEADEIRVNSLNEIESAQLSAQESADRVRQEADHYSEERRHTADVDAARVLETANQSAEELLDAADRDATARREEAEALYEQQRARAAQAAADFEMTLAQRRDRAEQDFSGRTAAAESQIASLVEQGEAQRLDNERARGDAERTVQRLIADANQQAQELLATAKTRADKIRAESDRELNAAAQRRDSINAQLTTLRQMLTTMSGASVADDPFRSVAGDSSVQVDVTADDEAAEGVSSKPENV